MQNMKDIVLFEGYNLEDLFKQIVTNARQTRKELKITIQDIASQLQSVTDIQILSPEISGYMSTLVKNDQILLKLAGIVSKLLDTKTTMMDDNDGELSDADKALLIKQAQEQLQPVFQRFKDNARKTA